ncbi:MAG: polysaccharide biosynthesis/export family protein [Deltaproteobacteria bacterium]|nr:polysaccharide biosynthesis/export family protein [Deltaproteobacteria bacterium]
MRAASVVMLLFLAACPRPDYDYPYSKEPDPRNQELVLGVSDVVAINVWENKDLNTEQTIRPDGTITMPLVGDLKAGGETPTSLKNQIKTRLQDFVKLQGTEITVAVKTWRSYRFRLSGEVQKEGIYTADGYLTVADALAMAGGVTRFAKRSDIVLLRSDPATRKQKQIPLDYDQLASGKRADMNIWVLPGDVIYVP